MSAIKEVTRTHVLMPRDLLDAVDRAVGRRRRSRFLAEAAREKLLRMERADAARAVAGSLAERHIPGWETAESATTWVRSLRRASDERGEEYERS